MVITNTHFVKNVSVAVREKIPVVVVEGLVVVVEEAEEEGGEACLPILDLATGCARDAATTSTLFVTIVSVVVLVGQPTEGA